MKVNQNMISLKSIRMKTNIRFEISIKDRSKKKKIYGLMGKEENRTFKCIASGVNPIKEI
jgi:hypothetical protein